jgi:16S rRNA (cytosine1402-N4)-methyltransferase
MKSYKDNKIIESHSPVLFKEVLEYLNIKKNGIYVDGTVGLGGHSNQILEYLSNKGRLIGVDRDFRALEICKNNLNKKNQNFSLHNDSYDNINSILNSQNIKTVDGILLDLGLSSYQLNDSERGFSFNSNGELDMRFDTSQSTKAKDILNHYETDQLADIIYKYGEERRSRVIAKNIIKVRPLEKISELVEAIRVSTPPKNRNKSIARVFQAIRITVNDELKKLDEFLSFFYKNLNIGGIIAIISFHSLEDRIVKHQFKKLEKESVLKIITKKPITPSEKELNLNRRARSSKLRVAQRV